MAESDAHPKKNKQSDVWNHFEELVGQKKTKCLRCDSDREPFAYHGGISNLREHLELQHSYKRDATQRNILDYANRD